MLRASGCLRIARHEAGTRVTFLRVESSGAISGKVERVLPHVIPLGPVAMQVRTTGALVEAAFPVKDARTGDLHVVRVKAPVALTEIAEPMVLPAISLPEPTSTMRIAFSLFGAPFPQGVGLLLRQPGDKAFLWTEQRGLKPLPFTLHDQDEALILGKRSAWYVLVNNGIQVRGEKVESFFDQYWPPSSQLAGPQSGTELHSPLRSRSSDPAGPKATPCHWPAPWRCESCEASHGSRRYQRC